MGALALLVGLLWASAAPAQPADSTDSLACLSLAIYWEAKGSNEEGMRAVGAVVLNRVDHPAFPGDVCAVVMQGGETAPCQFNFWCDGRPDEPDEPAEWQRARRLAEELLSGRAGDPTRGAIGFHNAAVAPSWTQSREMTARIGDHLFYR